jgi:N-acetylglucosamine kinase-like BadF-type ATPase
VLNVAEAGDPAAEGIVQSHGVMLAEYAMVAARKVHLSAPSFPLILNGGIFRNPGQKLVQAIIDHLLPVYPHVTPIRSRFEPVVGALLLALESADIMITADIMNQLERSLPSRELFWT